MHKLTAYQWERVLSKILLVVAGYIVVFKAYVYLKAGGIHFHDALGLWGIVERPYYHFLLTIFPYFYSRPYVRLLYNPHYWLKVVLDLFLPIMAIIAFEHSAYKSKAKYFAPFYFFVPAALYLIAALVVMRYFPSDS